MAILSCPHYVQWLINNNIPSQRHNFSEEEEEYFLELYRRQTASLGLSVVQAASDQ